MVNLKQILSNYCFTSERDCTTDAANHSAAVAFLKGLGIRTDIPYYAQGCEVCGNHSEVLEDMTYRVARAKPKSHTFPTDILIAEVYEGGWVLLRYDSWCAGEATVFGPVAPTHDNPCECVW